ncbi:MAG: 3-phosphoshikimate 1-carboxyvinyltransferase [Spirochaetaceae bacterium]|jgi:3-phosphoshikimate 1-carboxyvinyltransferase|nr:3-phosphoshikimate 1-carboxyvinyltransferase [Spirochaetaceae bacterium]
MRALIRPHIFSGTVQVPASKSHTIRRLIMAALTEGSSRIEEPLDALDTRSCAAACRVLGADLAEDRDSAGRLAGWIVQGRPGPDPTADRVKAANGALAGRTSVSRTSAGGVPPDAPPALCINVGNSGTTLFFALAAAALASVPVTFTGDGQIARRSAGPLLDALAGLGVSVSSARGAGGDCGYTPMTVRGPWKGGRVSMPCPTSQYLSALLIAAPLAPAGTVTEISVPLLNEKPYVDMTLDYLKTQGLFTGSPSAGSKNPADAASGPAAVDMTAAGDAAVVMAADYSYVRIFGGRSYRPINGPVPGDFSSAAFPAAAAAVSGGTVTLRGLDPADTQGDKVFFDHLVRMGCEVRWEKTAAAGCSGDAVNSPRSVTVSRTGPLRGGVFDLNATPDMLPVMAALAAHAEGETALTNAAHARIKETDRIAVMAGELGKLGVSCQERPGGLIIRGKSGGGIPGSAAPENAVIRLDGRGDHRIVMALACAALGRSGFFGQTTEIAGAEAADVTYPGFLELLGVR